MNSLTARRVEMLKQVKDFGIAHNGSFAAQSLGKELFDSVSKVISDLETVGANQVSGHSTAQNIASIKSNVREDLHDLLSAISRTARVLALDAPEFEAKFRMPRDVNDQKLLYAARAFLQDATPLKVSFIRHELPPDFLDRLSNLISSFDQAISQRTAAVGSHVAARLTIDEKVERGLQLVRQLDVIVRNKFHGDPVTLSAWMRASHVSKRTHSSGAEKPPTDPHNPPPNPAV